MAIKEIIQQLNKQFGIKELGLTNRFLGIEIKNTSVGFFVNQQQYASALLLRSGMLHAKPVSNPLPYKFASSPIT